MVGFVTESGALYCVTGAEELEATITHTIIILRPSLRILLVKTCVCAFGSSSVTAVGTALKNHVSFCTCLSLFFPASS